MREPRGFPSEVVDFSRLLLGETTSDGILISDIPFAKQSILPGEKIEGEQNNIGPVV